MTFIAVLLVLGASGLVGQILLLRELLVVFSGNELSIGIVLGNWLVLEALGCFLAGRIWARSERPALAFAVCQAFFAAALPAALYAARMLRDLCGVAQGEGFGVAAMLVSSLLLLACVSAPHGALFALACRMRLSGRGGPGAGGFVYGWETLGTLAGGLILTFLLIPRFHSFRIVLALSSLNLLFCLVVLSGAARPGRSLGPACGLGALAVAALAFGPAADSVHWRSVRRQWTGHEVVLYENSVYGNVTVLQDAGQFTFLADGVPVVTAPVPDLEFVEELAHFALLAHPNPREVLVLSGGAGGLLRETLKHPAARVDYAELDPLLLAALARFPTPLTESELKDPRVVVHEVDGRLLVKTSQRRYDVILIGAPRPSNLAVNRLFTREFFALARSRLKAGGLLAFSLPGSTAFMEKNLARLNSCLLQTAAGVFGHVRPIPGDRNLFLASDSDAIVRLDAGVLARRLRERRIRTGFVGGEQLAFRLEDQWTRMLRDFLAPVRAEAGINRDFSPRAVLHDLANWNAMFSPPAARLSAWAEALTLPRLAAFLAALTLALLVFHFRVRSLSGAAVPAAIAATGFGGMVYNISLTFAFQALYGYVYLWIGLLVSVFMAGAAGASLWVGSVPPVTRVSTRRAFIALEVALVLFSAALPMTFHWLARSPLADRLLQGAFLVLCLMSGGLTGAQFPLACRLRDCGPAGLYSCDLLGGWLGGIVGGAVLLPVLGLEAACLCVALLKLCSLALTALAVPPEGAA